MKASKKTIPLLLKTLPDQPGIYKFFDSNDKILYIGKAKNLRKRVKSYFVSRNLKNSELSEDTILNNLTDKKKYFELKFDNIKLQLLVDKVVDIKYIVVKTEIDALLLENNLIKKYQPPYNILLKDDKTYPWICIKNESFPRVFYTRNFINDGSKYFGPYPSHKLLFSLIEIIQDFFNIRTCNLNLATDLIKKNKYKACLKYQLKKCSAPCINLINEADYLNNISQIENILKGNLNIVEDYFRNKMFEYSDNLEFENAQYEKEKLLSLKKFQNKSIVSNSLKGKIDVFNIKDDLQKSYVNYLKINHGLIIGGQTYEIKKRMSESIEYLLSIAIAEVMVKFESNAEEIIVPFYPEVKFPNIKYTIPKTGDKKALLDLSENNIKYYIIEKNKKLSIIDPAKHSKRLLEKLKNDLNLKKLPLHIECFDNSNTQGTNPVSSMVCFKNAKPSKSEYRIYNVKTVIGPNDYATMYEVVSRRYTRLLDEKEPLPDLIIVDGGKGQLSAALKALKKLKLENRIEIISIAKRLEEIFKPNDSAPYYIDKTSESLKLIQQLRDEAHRFGIKHHRQKREKDTIKTELIQIKGIGKLLSQKLLQKYKSVNIIKITTKEELSKTIGVKKAEIIYNYFNNILIN